MRTGPRFNIRQDIYRKISWSLEAAKLCCRDTCQISEQSNNFKYKSRGFETFRDLTVRRLIRYWNRPVRPIPLPTASGFPLPVRTWPPALWQQDPPGPIVFLKYILTVTAPFSKWPPGDVRIACTKPLTPPSPNGAHKEASCNQNERRFLLGWQVMVASGHGKVFPYYRPSVGNPPVALMFSLLPDSTNCWTNCQFAGDLERFYIPLMCTRFFYLWLS